MCGKRTLLSICYGDFPFKEDSHKSKDPGMSPPAGRVLAAAACRAGKQDSRPAREGQAGYR